MYLHRVHENEEITRLGRRNRGGKKMKSDSIKTGSEIKLELDDFQTATVNWRRCLDERWFRCSDLEKQLREIKDKLQSGEAVVASDMIRELMDACKEAGGK